MRASNILTEQFELNALRDLSVRLAANPLLVQASTGNTSIKLDNVLWIKASGKWLVHAEEEDFFVPVNLDRAKRCLQEQTEIVETVNKPINGRCASIETAMHAVLPYKVVVHVHSVNTVAWTIRADGPMRLNALLAGLAWHWIPYAPSGALLASQIESALSLDSRTNIFVLANHGLVVCGNSCHSTERLLAEVEKRISIEPRPAPEPQYALLKQSLPGSAWFLPDCAGVHALATDHISRRILSGGVLYPCQAIFLPSTTPGNTPPPNSSPCPTGQALLVVQDQGILAGEYMPQAEWEILVGLANVVQRIDAASPLRYLTASEVRDVLGGGADSYRRIAGTNCLSKSTAASVEQGCLAPASSC